MKIKDEKPQELGIRTKAFALRIIRLYSALPKTTEVQVIGKHGVRSQTRILSTKWRADCRNLMKLAIG